MEEFSFLSPGIPCQKYVDHESIISSFSSQHSLPWGRKPSLQKQVADIWADGMASFVGMYERLIVMTENFSMAIIGFSMRPIIILTWVLSFLFFFWGGCGVW